VRVKRKGLGLQREQRRADEQSDRTAMHHLSLLEPV
jgi:hypothetical protein